MTIYPAIDLMNGRAVRLVKGLRDRATDYGDALDAARRWRDAGATHLHLVDLDGAFGTGDNLGVALSIVETLGMSVQLGGGIRDINALRQRLEAGVDRAILGTSALRDPDFFEEAARTYAGRIVVGIDVKEGRVAVQGWTTAEGGMTPEALGLRAAALGVTDCVFTDVSRDGTLEGVNVEATARLMRATGLRVIASGGVRDIADIRALQEAGVPGVIVGKALYEGTIDLAEAVRVAAG